MIVLDRGRWWFVRDPACTFPGDHYGAQACPCRGFHARTEAQAYANGQSLDVVLVDGVPALF